MAVYIGGQSGGIAAATPAIKGAAQPSQIVSPPNAALNAYTLPALAGTFAVAGSGASLVEAHTLPAAAGTLPITGSAANTLEAHRLAAVAGSVAIAGSPASSRRAARLTSLAGAVPISGASSALNEAHRLSAASAAVPVTGSASTLARSLRLSASFGPVPLTGAPASTNEAHRLVASAGAVTLSGSPSNFATALPAGAGAVPVAGSPVTFTYLGVAPVLRALTLTAAPVSVPIIGAPAPVTKQSNTRASSASMPVSGSNATFTQSAASTYTLAANAGALPANGNAASLRTQRRGSLLLAIHSTLFPVEQVGGLIGASSKAHKRRGPQSDTFIPLSQPMPGLLAAVQSDPVSAVEEVDEAAPARPLPAENARSQAQPPAGREIAPVGTASSVEPATAAAPSVVIGAPSIEVEAAVKRSRAKSNNAFLLLAA